MAGNRSYDLGKSSDPGRKAKENEDRLDVYEPQDHGQKTRKGALFVVADGMGGPEAGGVASDRAVRKLTEEYYYGAPTLEPRESLERAVKAANAALIQLGKENPDWKNMGSTVVAAAIRGDELYVANKGDSRGILFRPGQAPIRLSVDHTAAAEMVRRGEMTEEEAARSRVSHQLSHRLGKVSAVEAELMGPETLLPGDVLILCTDGLYTQLSLPEIQDVVTRFPAQEAADKLVARAKSGPGTDNISVIVVKWLGADGAVAAAQVKAKPDRRILPLVAAGVVIVGAAALLILRALSGTGPAAPSTPATTALPAGGTPTAAEILLATATSRPGISGPTSTLAPAPTSPPTMTPLPPTVTRVPTRDMAAPQYSAPALMEPADGADVSGRAIHFRWSWPSQLRPDEYFDLWAWPRGEAERALQGLKSMDATVDLPGGVGVYFWKVRVVRGEIGRPGTVALSPWSAVRSFDRTRLDTGVQPEPTSTVAPSETPIPTTEPTAKLPFTPEPTSTSPVATPQTHATKDSGASRVSCWPYLETEQEHW